MSKSIDYEEYLIESLKDPEEAAGYLNAVLEDGDIRVFLLALSHVIQAQGGVAKLALKINKSRTSLYKTMSAKGNPLLKNTNEILSAVGLRLVVCVNKKEQNPKKSKHKQKNIKTQNK